MNACDAIVPTSLSLKSRDDDERYSERVHVAL